MVKLGLDMIEIIKNVLARKPREFTVNQKAECMVLLQTAMNQKQQAHEMGIKVVSMPELKNQAKDLAEQANASWETYKSKCKLWE